MTKSITFKDEVAERLAFLHCEALGRLESNRFKEKHDITFIYDTDIILSFTAPWMKGPLQKNGENGYGQLIPHINKLGFKIDDQLPIPLQEDILAIKIAKHLATIAIDSSQLSRNIKNSTLLKNNDSSDYHGIWQFSSSFKETQHIANLVNNNANIARGEKLNSGKRDEQQRRREELKRQTIALATEALKDNKTQEEVFDYIYSRSLYGLLEGKELGQRRIVEDDNFVELNNTYGEFRELSNDVFKEKFLPSQNDSAKQLYEIEHHARIILFEFWRYRLGKFKHVRHFNNTQLDTDIQALIDLTVWNKRLIRNGIHHRLTFVTGDNSLVKATYGDMSEISRFISNYIMQYSNSGKSWPSFAPTASELNTVISKYFGFYNGKKIIDDLDPLEFRKHRWFKNFSYHYIRHLWALAIETFFDHDQFKQDFLHGFYATYSDRLRSNRKRIEMLLSNSKRQVKNSQSFNIPEHNIDNEKAKELIKSWFEAVKKFESKNSLANGDERLRFTQASLNKLDGDLDPLTLYDECVARAVDHSMLSYSREGATHLFNDLGKIIRPPNLYFKTLEHTYDIFKWISHNHENKLDAKEFLDKYNKIAYDCYPQKNEDQNHVRTIKPAKERHFDDRQESHLKFLVLAALFAATEKWSVAIGHVDRALNVIDRTSSKKSGKILTHEKKPSFMSGREANFLKAVCLRKMATSEEDIESAKIYIKNARKCLVNDIEETDEKEEMRKRHELRFENETVSIYLVNYYIFRYKKEKELDISKKQAIELIDKYDFILDKVNKLKFNNFEKLEQDDCGLTYDNIAFNILHGKVIASYWEIINFEDKEVEKCLDWLAWRRDNGFSEPPVVTIFRKLCGNLLNNDKYEKFEHPDEIDQLYEKAIERNGERITKDVTNYEYWRLKAVVSYSHSQFKGK